MSDGRIAQGVGKQGEAESLYCFKASVLALKDTRDAYLQ